MLPVDVGGHKWSADSSLTTFDLGLPMVIPQSNLTTQNQYYVIQYTQLLMYT